MACRKEAAQHQDHPEGPGKVHDAKSEYPVAAVPAAALLPIAATVWPVPDVAAHDYPALWTISLR